MEVSFNLVDGKCIGTFVLDKEAKNVLIREVKQSDKGPHFGAIEEFEKAHNLKLLFDNHGAAVLEVLPSPIAEIVPEENEPFVPSPMVESFQENKEEE